MPIQVRILGLFLRTDVACRLGPVALVRYGRHRLAMASGRAARRLAGAGVPQESFLTGAPPPPTPVGLEVGKRQLALAGAEAQVPPPAPAHGNIPPHPLRVRLATLPPPRLHGPFDASAPALGMDLFRPGDIRPLWEPNRLGWLPELAQAARLWPEEDHLASLESRLAAWCAANPPFLGPHWACGQEAALRALHLALALALLGQDKAPAPGAREFLLLHARRIGATPHYAQAQDNNHSISEPAGLFACGLLLGDVALRQQGARGLVAALARLVAPDGGFAQVSTGYHRLLLDVLATVEWLRRRHGAPPLPAPFAQRAAAASRWMARLVAPDGAMPRLGHQDGSAFADLSLAGPGDARGSAERAMRLFTATSAGFADDPGCRWLGLPPVQDETGLDIPPLRPAVAPPVTCWRASGSMGWQAGNARALLRAGPLRFRPGQADLLNFELWNGSTPILTDAGTGAYNPAAGDAWWLDYFTSAAAHNGIVFDGQEPMPRAGRFLYARWPRLRPLPAGASLRDTHGHRHAREIFVDGRDWRVRDTVGGGFGALALRWRLGPGAWKATATGASGTCDGASKTYGGASGGAEISFSADAPLTIALEPGWESPAYGVVRPCTVLVARATAPVRHIETLVKLR